MYKRIIFMFFLTLIISFVLSASNAEDATCGSDVYYSLDAEGALYIYGSGEIQNNPWRYDSSVRTIVVSEGITGSSISETFADLPNLTDVVFPQSYSSLNAYDFARCTSLAEITLPSTITEFGEYTFYYCSNLSKLTINSKVTKIPLRFCLGCSKLTTLILPDSVSNIETNAFSTCYSLNTVSLPNSIVSIASNSFPYGTSFVSEIGSSSAKALGNIGCSFRVKDDICVLQYISDSLYIISLDSQDITEYAIPDKVEKIGLNALFGCYDLKSITIPGSVEYIEEGFVSNSGIKEIHFPGNIQFVHSDVLYEMDSSVILFVPDKECDTAKALSEIGYSFREEGSSFSLMYPYNSYTVMDGFVLDKVDKEIASFTIPEYVSVIGTYAFSDHQKISQVVIPDSVIAIEQYAFENCSKLKRIFIPDSVISIEELAFELTDIIVECNRGSFAHKYAIEHGLKYRCSNYAYEAKYGWGFIQASFDDGANVKAQADDNLVLNGDAEITYANNDHYVGNLLDCLKSYTGTYTWSDGSQYEGEFANDKIDGDGVYSYIYNNRECSLSGTFVQGVISGDAVFTCDGEVYNTTWDNGVCTGCFIGDISDEGWHNDVDGIYYIYNGQKVTGWILIDENYYHFDSDGNASIGLTQIENKTYYFDKNGVLKVGSLKIMNDLGKEQYYFFDNNGVMQTGFVNVNGTYVYYNHDGAADLRGITMIGDINSDSLIDGRDILRLLKYLQNKDEDVIINPYNADVNGDHLINQTDCDLISQYLTGMIDSLIIAAQ